MVRLTILLSLCVYGLGFLGGLADPLASPIWPATGFQIAMFFRYGYKAIWAMTPGLLIIQLQSSLQGGLGIWGSLIFSIISWTAMLSEAVLTYQITRSPNHSLDTQNSYIRFALLGAPIGTMSSAIQGVTVLHFFNAYPNTVHWYVPYLVWFFGNIIGAYVVTPLLTLRRKYLEELKQNLGSCLIFLLLFGFIITSLAINTDPSIDQLITLLLIVAVYYLIRLQRYSIMVCVASFSTIYFIALQLSDFTVINTGNNSFRFLTLQLTIGLLLSLSMIVFSQIKKNRLLSKKLMENNAVLGQRVAEQTQQLSTALAKQNQLNQELKRINNELKIYATTDGLTNLLNRRSFIEIGQQVLARYKRNRQPIGILMFDIDHFKRINDRYGHQAGDQVIQQVSRAATHILRDMDAIGRLGGEEFAAILPECTLTASLEVAERIRSAIEQTKVDYHQDTIQVTVSIGVSQILAQDRTLEEGLARADMALYGAKRSGRNKICVDSDMTTLT